MDAATTGTWVGIVLTLGIAVVGWARANRADHRAARALELAESAERRADRIEQRQLQRTDVAWEHHWRKAESAVTFRNIGTDTAYQVEIVIDPVLKDRRRQRRQRLLDHVAPGESVAVELEDWVRGIRGYNRAASRWPAMAQKSVEIHARVAWRHTTGVPGVYEARSLLIT